MQCTTLGKLAGVIGISEPAMLVTSYRLPELAAIMVKVGKALSKRMTFTNKD
jgi:hypothetical protein